MNRQPTESPAVARGLRRRDGLPEPAVSPEGGHGAHSGCARCRCEARRRPGGQGEGDQAEEDGGAAAGVLSTIVFVCSSGGIFSRRSRKAGPPVFFCL